MAGHERGLLVALSKLDAAGDDSHTVQTAAKTRPTTATPALKRCCSDRPAPATVQRQTRREHHSVRLVSRRAADLPRYAINDQTRVRPHQGARVHRPDYEHRCVLSAMPVVVFVCRESHAVGWHGSAPTTSWRSSSFDGQERRLDATTRGAYFAAADKIDLTTSTVALMPLLTRDLLTKDPLAKSIPSVGDRFL
jgi:hypothetical protein